MTQQNLLEQSTMFQRILDARIKDLWNFFEISGGLSHPGEKGMLREAFLKRVLESVLPPHFGVGGGIIVDRWNRHSNQIDIVIYDKRLVPPFLEESGHGIYPIDAVLRAVEVKSSLDKPGLEQYKNSAWLLNPANPHGLKIASAGNLDGGQAYYPVFSLFAYKTLLADVSVTANTLEGWSENTLCCVATKGIYRGADFHLTAEEDVVVNARIFVVLFLNLIEDAAASRKAFSLHEWLF